MKRWWKLFTKPRLVDGKSRAVCEVDEKTQILVFEQPAFVPRDADDALLMTAFWNEWRASLVIVKPDGQ